MGNLLFRHEFVKCWKCNQLMKYYVEIPMCSDGTLEDRVLNVKKTLEHNLYPTSLELYWVATEGQQMIFKACDLCITEDLKPLFTHFPDGRMGYFK